MSANKAAFLHKVGESLLVGDAPMPTAGPGEIVVRNAAVAVNPLDTHMLRSGIFIKHWPAIFGCDVAGHVHEVGTETGDRFKPGDRVIGHAINLNSGRPEDSAFALYSVVPANKAAILPDNIPFTEGAVLPLILEAAVCALFVKENGIAMPGVKTPALGLPYPSLEPNSINKVLVVYGGSAGTGLLVTQLANAAGLKVISLLSKRHADLGKTASAFETIDYQDKAVVDKVVEVVTRAGGDFVGIFDAIATEATFPHDLDILAKLGGGHLACTHPPPKEVPENVKAGMIWAVNDAATPVWRDYVTPALQAGKLKCLPAPLVVGKGLEAIQTALEKCEAGVSGQKLVVEL